MADIRKYALVRFSKKTGKIDTTLTALGNAMLRLWAMQNTTSSKQCLIFCVEDGRVIFKSDGKKDDFPTITWEEDLGYIDEYCDGLLEGFQ